MEREALIQRVKELILPLLANRQAELVDLVCHYGGGRLQLKCLVDTPRGVTLEELSSLNRAIGALLEEHEAIAEPYLLEVSSPGLDRPLKTGTDFDRIIGRRVRIFTAAPLDSRTEHHGEVLSANEESVMLRLDSGDKLPVPLSQIVRAEQEIKL